ncbi:magnesium transporter [Halorubrum vacuolatum]|uniref:Magnesium transporter MgtE n=1 Tax=Halorubrum vacuolatum TaxID=63740 RepID=A0A238VVE7_HALVU|nr:magnesium transporter [Halorubrum vacuolatum]SNR37803.1 magnesium transporter [Halorubrum vacuolatum]
MNTDAPSDEFFYPDGGTDEGAPSEPIPEQHFDTVSEVLTGDYVAVGSDTFAGIAIERFREFAPTDEDETTVYYVYVVEGADENGEPGELVGVLSLRELLNAPEDTPVSEIMTEDLITLGVDDEIEPAARRMRELEFPVLPVTDADGALRGVLRADDMMGALEEEATEDIMKSAGISFSSAEEARSTAILESSISRILRLRLPWLLVALAGGLAAGLVIEGFEETLDAVIVLGFFIPVIMDMGGNVGTQASTIFVRGLALGHIDDENAMRHFARETKVGLVIGVIIGSIGALAAYGWIAGLRGEAADAGTIAFVIFVSLVAVCVIASLVGYVIPWIAHKLDYDPAAVSDPLVTTVKDVTALVIYFGLATVLLAHLL